MTGKILVIGSTGTIGTPLVKALLAKGESVKAASRTGKAAEGAEGVRFDYTDASTYTDAFDGVDRLFLILAGGRLDAIDALTPVVEEAARRNVKIVFLSVFGVDADDSIPYRQVELKIIASGAPYVILRPNWFADNFHTYWKVGIEHGQIAVPAGEGKSSFIDVRDIADSAAAALTSTAFDNKAFNLTGPKAFSYGEAAAIISQAIGKPVGYSAVSDDVFIGILTGAGVPKDYAAFLASIFYPVREGWTSAVTGDVETLTGHAPRSLETYVADHVAALKD
ncbi:NmrA family protein [Agrobacterium fabacearum CFBP 5771]|uniref:SDR family oxidoreductase n=1 Tax=Rhizobium/Agrobacterium group TaxID=227290 RepID=UPI000471F173|nr:MULTISPECIES: SDR family oxidoreductase [Rhizobium/Agrobacterium group]KQY53346.1 NAD(P)-dependent oxidoreductase [Rhizobium sp. Root491]MDR5008185.1 SDR family oxidoreductase [Agrobacterium tumefaciens]NSY58015.1 SDR family oxidoreductase [Agrobacterium tumefaciens]NTZ59490.1 SDR family oxidoreductase [Agrobacterium tumefaciens]OMP73087.1 NAD(P)-dependent oxidoreductase [Agrobacterium tumefaciens]